MVFKRIVFALFLSGMGITAVLQAKKYDNPLKGLGVDFMVTEKVAPDAWVGWLRVPEFGKRHTAVFAFVRRLGSDQQYRYSIDYIDNDKSIAYDLSADTPKAPEYEKGMLRPYPKLPRGLFRTEDGPIVNHQFKTFKWDPRTKKWLHRPIYGKGVIFGDGDRPEYPSQTIRSAFESIGNKQLKAHRLAMRMMIPVMRNAKKSAVKKMNDMLPIEAPILR